MEHLGSVLKGFQGTGPLGRSRTWKKATKECANCHKEYQSGYWEPDQTEPAERPCSACFQKERDEEARAQAEQKLPEVIKERRCVWEEQSSMPGGFLTKTFATFKRELQPKAYDAIKSLRYHYEDYDDQGNETPCPPESIILLSPNLYGVGGRGTNISIH